MERRMTGLPQQPHLSPIFISGAPGKMTLSAKQAESSSRYSVTTQAIRAFPRPDELLWSSVINTDEYTGRLWSTSPTKNQGWYDPRETDEWNANEHKKVYQYNIDTIDNPFIQQAGQTYWMEISMDFQGCEWGWKTTENVSGNSSVFWDSYNVWGPHDYWHRHPEIEWKWTQLKTPQGTVTLEHPVDLAFVLTTPEPATLFLLAAGAVAALRRRSR